MKLYAPGYYTAFACIADKCRHSCCIGWERDIDENTAKRYGDLPDHGYGTEIKNSIDTEGTPHFVLENSGRCPHLDAHGLCRIITELGEGHLCDICREHPRFYNNTPHGMEAGLGMACEEACRIILSSDKYSDIIQIGEISGIKESGEFNSILQREKIYSKLADRSVPYSVRLDWIGKEYSIALSAMPDSYWKELMHSLEYLDDAHKGLFSNYSSDPKTPEIFERWIERALAYFIYRHCSGAYSRDEFRSALGFGLFCERLLASSAKAEGICNAGGIMELARIVSEELEYSEDNTEAIRSEFMF